MAGLIVVLGSPNDAEGRLSEMGLGRIGLGKQLYFERAHEGWRLLLTGGFGAHFNITSLPHAHYARTELLRQGVPADAIVAMAESCNTVDDALKTRPIVERLAVRNLCVVSSDFHLPRVQFVFGEVFPDHTLTFAGAAYLETRPPEERERLLAHEARELESLRTRRASIVGGSLSLDAWKSVG